MADRKTFTPPRQGDVTRLAVLGALVRGMSFAYAARTCTTTVDHVREIADDAGWPDIDAVRATHTALRNAEPPRTRSAPPARKAEPKPAPPKPTETERLAAQVHIPDGLNSREGAAALGKLLGEYFAEVDEVVDAITDEEVEQKLTTLLAGQHTNPYGLGEDVTGLSDAARTNLIRLNAEDAEREYRGEVVQTGPLPEHLEPLAAYVARVGSHQVPTKDPDPAEAEAPIGPAVQVVREEFAPDGTRRILETKVLGMSVAVSPLVQPDAVVVAVGPEVRPETDPVESSAPKPVKRSASRPGTVPCEGCGVGVLASWVEANGDGVQRHKHCREGA